MKSLALKAAAGKATRELSQQEYLYLYSTLIIFNTRHHLSMFQREEAISGDQLQELYEALKAATTQLIEACYRPPDHQHISRYSTEYGTILYRGKEVKVNYSTLPVGRLMVGLQYLLDFIKRVQQEEDVLLIAPAPAFG